jgi:hypothetical protein
MSDQAPSPHNWFRDAERWYIEKHQGCPWCGGANCVYKSERGQRIEYSCGGCDFFTCYDGENGTYYMGAGQTARGRLTMHAY